jgi:hypothetical protein
VGLLSLFLGPRPTLGLCGSSVTFPWVLAHCLSGPQVLVPPLAGTRPPSTTHCRKSQLVLRQVLGPLLLIPVSLGSSSGRHSAHPRSFPRVWVGRQAGLWSTFGVLQIFCRSSQVLGPLSRFFRPSVALPGPPAHFGASQAFHSCQVLSVRRRIPASLGSSSGESLAHGCLLWWVLGRLLL